jgi:hypothetical protein
MLLLANGHFNGSRVPAIVDGEGEGETVGDADGVGEGETLPPRLTSHSLTTPGTGSVPNAVLLQPMLVVTVLVT